MSVQGIAPVSGVFPTDGGLHLLEIGIQAIQLSPYHAGSRNASPHTPEHDRCFSGRLLSPSSFRIQVSHQTQEPPSEFLPAAPGIRPGASWRTDVSTIRGETQRTDKREYVYRGTIDIASIKIWLRDLTRKDSPDTP
jgi:hypothetical protein